VQSVKDKLHIANENPEEKQKEEDKQDVEKIAKDEHDSPTDVGREQHQVEDDSLPGDGKKVEEMTDEERMERGLALVARAWDRGIEARVKKSAEGGEAEAKADGKAEQQESQ